MLDLTNSFAVMDINNTDVRVVSVHGNKIKKWVYAPIPEGAIKDGIVLEPDTVAIIMDNLFKSLNLKRNRVICTMTGLPFIYRVVTMPKGDKETPGEAVERAARREMSVTDKDMYLVWQQTEAKAESNEQDFFALGVPKTSMRPLLETLEKANIKPYMMDIKPLALARAASFKDALIVSLERSYFDIVLVANGMVRVIHSVSPSARPDDLVGIVNELADGLNKAVKSFNRDYPQNNLAADTPLLLAGELSSNPKIKQLVRDATGYPVNSLKPQIYLPADMPVELYASTVGLISKKAHGMADGAGYRDIELNIFSALKDRNAPRFQYAYFSVAAAVILLAGAVYKTYDMKAQAYTQVDNLQKQIGQSTQMISAAQKANQQGQAAKKAASDKLQSLTAELAAVTGEHKSILSQQHDYSNRIVAVTAALPQNSKFTELNMLPTSIVVKGGVNEAIDVLGFTETLEKNGDFSAARISEIAPLLNPQPGDPQTTFQVTISQ